MLVSALLVACAPASTTRPSTTLNALYAHLNQASKGYETALQQSQAGNQDAAQKTLSAALSQLKDAASRCGTTPGCDPQRFFAVFDRLLQLKSDSTLGEANLDTVGESSSDVTIANAKALSQAQRSVTLLHGQQLSKLIAMNGPVKAALEKWLTQWRPNLIEAWINYQYLRAQMWPQYQRADLPEAVLFGILAKESGGKVHAVSRSGAAGPLQFMPATGMRFGLNSDSGFDTRFDPAASARANAQYVNEQLKVFNDNLEDTLAAYNGGEGRMRRLVGDRTSTSFYDPSIYNQLPQETRDYVPSVLAAAWLFLHPGDYNLHFPRVFGAPGSVTLQAPASISELTVCLGGADGMDRGWFRILRNLNPKLDPEQVQAAGTTLALPKRLEKAYAARCVGGPWPILANDLHEAVELTVNAPPPPTPRPARHEHASKHYKVRHGDTLGGIAGRYRCVSTSELKRMNGIKGHALGVGQVLKVPDCR